MTKTSPKAKNSLEKFLSFSAIQNDKSWLDYIDNGALNLREIGKICSISRSTLYDNELVKSEVINVAMQLLNKGIIQKLPYANDIKNISKVNKVVAAKSSKEVDSLRSENQSLKNRVNELLVQLDTKNSELKKFKSMERILGDSGRVPR